MVERSLDMEDSMEKDVDAARCAANRVADARKKAKGLKDDALQNNAQQEDWALYKALGRLQAVEAEAQAACDEAKGRRSAVQKAIVLGDPLARLAGETADRAYEKALDEMREVSKLVEKVAAKLRERLKYLS